MNKQSEQLSTLGSVDNQDSNSDLVGGLLFNLFSPKSLQGKQALPKQQNDFNKQQIGKIAHRRADSHFSEENQKVENFRFQGKDFQNGNEKIQPLFIGSLQDSTRITVKSSRNFNEIKPKQQYSTHSKVSKQDSVSDKVEPPPQNDMSFRKTNTILQVGESLLRQDTFNGRKAAANATNLQKQINLLSPAKDASGRKPLGVKKFATSKVINDPRIKLKDYIFMSRTSANLAASSRRNQDKPTEQLNKTTASEPQVKNNKNNPVPCQLPSFTKIKKNQQKQKYGITNQQMSIILKKQIKSQLNELRSKIQALQKSIEGKSDQIDSEDLLSFYTVRGIVKKYNQQFQANVNKLEGIVDTRSQNLQAVIELFKKHMFSQNQQASTHHQNPISKTARCRTEI